MCPGDQRSGADPVSDPSSWTADLRQMGRVAAPVVLINVGLQLMGVVDTLMVGRLGGSAIAAVALGNFYFFNVSVFGIGLLMVIDPVVSQAIGAAAHDDAAHDDAARGIQRGYVLAVLVALAVMLALWPGDTLLTWARQPASVVQDTAIYARIRSLGALPFFLFLASRQALQAMGTVRPVIVAVAFGNVVNLVANWAFIHGHLGAPAMGVAGSGAATALATWSMCACLALTAHRELAPYVRPWRPESTAWGPLQRTLRLGTPIGTQFFFESFAFGLTALFMGWFGAPSLAGHEIALNMAALTYMVPLGISSAAAVVVGRAIGRGDMLAARRDAVAAILVGVGFMTMTAVVFLAAPTWLATRYTSEPATLAVAVALIPLAGVFQVFDALQAVTSGVLRGTGDTRIPAVLHLVAFWGVGIPLGMWLGFQTPLRERGLWIGLVSGLAAAAVLQSLRVRSRLRGTIARVQVDR